ncbi:drug/metabolite transporter (DMT)-like permease [Janthinobacterium sp. CG_23.3]|uniref:DMT family transporter n=1 Tax=unclassified Janthinobacterium TaxID=2610881 RepID=UPI0006864AA7|nr:MULTISPECIES: DMT family transporter [unclassified Janthinobacterium]MEC5162886.1 drug/metabolite transporter (DMT)-like permease [Janthinobacterium sp. CG_S6]
MSHPSIPFTAAMLMLATLGVFIHEAGLDPVTTVFFRCAFGAAILLLFCAYKGMLTRRNVSAKNLGLALFSGVLMCVNWVTFFEAIHRVGISAATIVFHVQPFLVLILGSLLLKERVSADNYGWVGVGFAGLVLACGLGPDTSLSTGYLIGIAFTLTGAVAYAGVTLTTRSIRGMPPTLTALTHCVTAAVLTAGFVTIPAGGIAAGQWAWLAGLGLIPTALAYVLIYGATPRMETAAIAVLTFVYPASAVVLDVLVYDHIVGATQVAGFALIVAASLGVNLRWRFFPSLKRA